MTQYAVGARHRFNGNLLDPLPPLIDAIGEEHFSDRLLGFLSSTCGAEHCAVFKFDRGIPASVISASLDGTDTAKRQAKVYIERDMWRFDPAMSEALECRDAKGPRLTRFDIASLPDSELRNIVYRSEHISDRMLLCGEVSGSVVGLSLLRTERRGLFSSNEANHLSEAAQTLLALIAKHSSFSDTKPDFRVALASLEEIERTIDHASETLPHREAQVCARILYGMTALGISLDLSIGEETVMTYRKRAYRRLNLGCQRELLTWYIAEWSDQHGGSA